MGVEPIRDIKHETAADFTSRIKSVREEAEAALTKASDEIKCFADFRRGNGLTLKVGDKVYVDASDYTTERPSKKLSNKRIGPYLILEIINDNAFKLKLPSSMKIYPVFTRSKLRLYSPPTIPGQSMTPQGPVVIEGEERYNVEAILNSKLTRGKLFYLVKWEGWSREHNTWEPESHLNGSRKLVEKFHREHPSAPRRIFTDDFKNLTFCKIQNFTDLEVTASSIKTSRLVPLKSAPKGQIRTKPTDMVLYIKPEFVSLILNKTKNHEFRKYCLDDSVKRLWLFENGVGITTVLSVGKALEVGKVKENGGIRNKEFNEGLKESKFAYPIYGAYKIRDTITNKIAKNVFDHTLPSSHFDAPT